MIFRVWSWRFFWLYGSLTAQRAGFGISETKNTLSAAVPRGHGRFPAVAFVCLRTSPQEFYSVWHQSLGKRYIGIDHHDQAYDRTQRNRVPENEAEDHAFVADLIGCCGVNADGLCVHHLTHHPAGAIAS